jgi:hypothetical protein
MKAGKQKKKLLKYEKERVKKTEVITWKKKRRKLV